MAIVAVLVVWVLLEQTTFGRRLYAIGGNIEAALSERRRGAAR